MAKSALQRAIEDGDVVAARDALAARPSLGRERLERGGTYLKMAASAAEAGPELVQVLLEAGADVTASDDHGLTALHAAIDVDRPPAESAGVIALLVRAGAGLEARGQYGWTPLMYAVERGGAAEVEALLEAGARASGVVYPETSPAFAKGRTLLDLAKGDPRKVELLERAGA